MSSYVPELSSIEGLKRIEEFDRDQMAGLCLEETHAVYPHQQIYGKYCTIEEYINCPPEDVFQYLADGRSLEEWTWSTRDFVPTDEPGLMMGWDRLADDTKIYCRTISNADAMTVDYHCAWDQGEHLWMIYLMRVVPAQLVLGKPGSVVLWSNCHHPNYDENPYPWSVPEGRDTWVGQLWHFFYAGHVVEMQNLKKILEHRHATGQTIRPWNKSAGSESEKTMTFQ
ncbi:MAG: SRPBCC family protein [Myxococcales bacterium]|nr:SRPBCC family protein [Myxococcales bacterium]